MACSLWLEVKHKASPSPGWEVSGGVLGDVADDCCSVSCWKNNQALSIQVTDLGGNAVTRTNSPGSAGAALGSRQSRASSRKDAVHTTASSFCLF